MADHLRLHAVAFGELDRLREVARRHPHVVARRAQPLDDRAQHEHVRAVGQVDPDAHRAIASTTSCTCSRVIAALIGMARCSRAARLVPGSDTPADAWAHIAIAGCWWT